MTLARRAVLVVPGASERLLAKAAQLTADELVLDLEDAVSVADKPAARALVRTALATLDRPVAVRVNAIGSPWVLPDIVSLVEAERPPASLVVPKIESRDDVAFLDRLLAGLEQSLGRAAPRLQVLIETAAGIRQLDHILTASQRVDTVILGYADLAASLGARARHPDHSAAWAPYQTAVVAAARAAGVQPIDGPYLALDDPAGLATALATARDLGFAGTWVIHPSQLGPALAAFTPTEAQIAQARAVLAQLDAGRAGAQRHDGQMIDEAVAKAAHQLLSRATTS